MFFFVLFFWNIYKDLVLFDGECSIPQDWCQFLHVITQYAIVCNFAWMFCEGLYLHTVMMSAFTSGKSVIIACLIIGWGKRNHILIVLPITDVDVLVCWMYDTILCNSIIGKFNTLHYIAEMYIRRACFARYVLLQLMQFSLYLSTIIWSYYLLSIIRSPLSKVHVNCILHSQYSQL